MLYYHLLLLQSDSTAVFLKEDFAQFSGRSELRRPWRLTKLLIEALYRADAGEIGLSSSAVCLRPQKQRTNQSFFKYNLKQVKYNYYVILLRKANFGTFAIA